VIDVTADIGETKESIEQTIRFATEINPRTIQVSIAAPYPGTYLHRQAVENGWLDHEHAELFAPLSAAQPSRDFQLSR
jgi:radical SAM superfamily enzyme YgiQ (UPF0313 family)